MQSFVAMILGFGQRIQTVSENDASPGQESFDLNIPITSLRTSEIAYFVGIRSVIRGQPIIEPMDDIQNPMYDGTFGSREENTINNLVAIEILEVNTAMLLPLQVTIRHDFFPENEECFGLSIFQVNPELFVEQFTCNTAGNEFFCQHEICITDAEGRTLHVFKKNSYICVFLSSSAISCWI